MSSQDSSVRTTLAQVNACVPWTVTPSARRATDLRAPLGRLTTDAVREGD